MHPSAQMSIDKVTSLGRSRRSSGAANSHGVPGKGWESGWKGKLKDSEKSMRRILSSEAVQRVQRWDTDGGATRDFGR